MGKGEVIISTHAVKSTQRKRSTTKRNMELPRESKWLSVQGGGCETHTWRFMPIAQAWSEPSMMRFVKGKAMRPQIMRETTTPKLRRRTKQMQYTVDWRRLTPAWTV